jgi:isohexenylglutaconyl-CoA hydratase
MALIRTRAHGRSLTLTLADPKRQNALSADMVGEIEAVFDALPADLAALVVEGEGGVFCAGADVKALSAALAAGGEALEQINSAGGRFFARFAALPCATIALVDGPAMGGGMGLASAADIVVATPRARFALSETSLGLTPAQIAPYLVARLGERVARRLALTGARLDGAEAARLGLADALAESDGRAEVEALLAAVERCAPAANAETKRLLAACRRETPEAYIALAARSFAAAARGEGSEGLAAFLEKRPPAWARGRA